MICEYKEAERYAEALLIAHKSVKKGVAAVRQEQNRQRKEFLGISGRGKISDPTANAAINNIAPLPVIRCYHEGQAFTVVAPESWLEAIKKSFDMYRSRYGEKALRTILNRYDRGWSVQRICSEENISKRLYQQRRSDYLQCLLLQAVQRGLIEFE